MSSHRITFLCQQIYITSRDLNPSSHGISNTLPLNQQERDVLHRRYAKYKWDGTRRTRPRGLERA